MIDKRDLQISVYDSKAKYEIVMKMIKAFCDIIRQVDKDKKRILSRKEKEISWQGTKKAPGFDPDYFRVDWFGCLVMKHVQYIKEEPSSKLSYDSEHIASHSAGGPTTVANSIPLNSAINRIKKAIEGHEISWESMKNFVKKYGITPREFRKDAKEHGIDYVSKKHNLLFEYNEKNQIRPVVSGTTSSGKPIYAVFSENIEEATKNIDWDSNVETVVITVIVIVGVVVVVTVVVVTTKFLWERVPIWYEKLKFFIEENKRIEENKKECSKFADIICLKNNEKRSIFEKIGAGCRDICIAFNEIFSKNQENKK